MQNPSTMPGQPQLGTPVPGTTGGLPALGGLSVTQNPMAQELQSYGRGDDSMLVHMTPAEVNSLQGLAMAHGGSLTINPHTGLPEAGWLGKLLPTILGFAGAAFGLPTWAIGLGGAAAGTAATGNLGKGLMMGLQAYGGASLAGGLGVGAAGKAATQAAAGAQADKLAALADKLPGGASSAAFQQAAAKAPGMLDKFGAFASKGLPGILGKAAPMLAGSAVLGAVSDATQPKMPTYKPEESSLKYTPMAPLQRQVRFQTPEQMEASGGAEYQYFTPVNPEPMPLSQVQQQQNEGFADGGEVAASMVPAAPAAPAGFNELVAAYNANNPGAITASMKYPTSTAQPTEQRYNFRPTTQTGAAGAAGTATNTTPSAPDSSGNWWYGDLGEGYGTQWWFAPDRAAAARGAASSTGTSNAGAAASGAASSTGTSNAGGAALSGTDLSGLNLGNLGNFDFSNLTIPTQSVPAAQTQTLPAQQQTYEASVFTPTESLGMYPDVNSYGGNSFGRAEYVNEYARGGGVNMRDGAFVVDARTVSELGNGSSNAGMEFLARMGGKPVRGPGDGVSDSVPASIGGKQKARVARDEVIFQPEAVRRIGKGSEKRGTQKLYALMDKAHKARKKAKRGQDTGVRKGLA